MMQVISLPIFGRKYQQT